MLDFFKSLKPHQYVFAAGVFAVIITILLLVDASTDKFVDEAEKNKRNKYYSLSILGLAVILLALLVVSFKTRPSGDIQQQVRDQAQSQAETLGTQLGKKLGSLLK